MRVLSASLVPVAPNPTALTPSSFPRATGDAATAAISLFAPVLSDDVPARNRFAQHRPGINGPTSGRAGAETLSNDTHKHGNPEAGALPLRSGVLGAEPPGDMRISL